MIRQFHLLIKATEDLGANRADSSVFSGDISSPEQLAQVRFHLNPLTDPCADDVTLCLHVHRVLIGP